MSDRITKEMIHNWIHHPISSEFLKLVQEHREANYQALQGYCLQGNMLDQSIQQKILQLQGQILALDQVLDTKDFLSELTEKNEVIHEIHIEGAEDSTEG